MSPALFLQDRGNPLHLPQETYACTVSPSIPWEWVSPLSFSLLICLSVVLTVLFTDILKIVFSTVLTWGSQMDHITTSYIDDPVLIAKPKNLNQISRFGLKEKNQRKLDRLPATGGAEAQPERSLLLAHVHHLVRTWAGRAPVSLVIHSPDATL